MVIWTNFCTSIFTIRSHGSPNLRWIEVNVKLSIGARLAGGQRLFLRRPAPLDEGDEPRLSDVTNRVRPACNLRLTCDLVVPVQVKQSRQGRSRTASSKLVMQCRTAGRPSHVTYDPLRGDIILHSALTTL